MRGHTSPRLLDPFHAFPKSTRRNQLVGDSGAENVPPTGDLEPDGRATSSHPEGAGHDGGGSRPPRRPTADDHPRARFSSGSASLVLSRRDRDAPNGVTVCIWLSSSLTLPAVPSKQ